MEENELIPVDNNNAVEYTDDNIRHLSDMEHVRTRPGMYIGRLGDGAHAEDGIYVLLKEVIDNSIDEFKMQAGKKIEITVEENLRVSVRDYGRGIPQGKLIEAVSMLNTGGKYDSKAFKKSVGLNGVGVKAVNALSSRFEVRSYRDGKVRIATFSKGTLLTDETQTTEEDNGTYIFFEPDNTLFLNYCFKPEFIETMLRNYTYLNTGLAIIYNGHRILSRNGLVDLHDGNRPLPYHPPERRRHRNSLHPHRTIRRRILLLRQRSAHHPGRYSPECFQGTYRPYYQRVLQQEHGLYGHPQRTRCRHCRQRGGTDLREPDQDEAGFYQHGARRHDRQ